MGNSASARQADDASAGRLCAQFTADMCASTSSGQLAVEAPSRPQKVVRTVCFVAVWQYSQC